MPPQTLGVRKDCAQCASHLGSPYTVALAPKADHITCIHSALGSRMRRRNRNTPTATERTRLECPCNCYSNKQSAYISNVINLSEYSLRTIRVCHLRLGILIVIAHRSKFVDEEIVVSLQYTSEYRPPQTRARSPSAAQAVAERHLWAAEHALILLRELRAAPQGKNQWTNFHKGALVPLTSADTQNCTHVRSHLAAPEANASARRVDAQDGRWSHIRDKLRREVWSSLTDGWKKLS